MRTVAASPSRESPAAPPACSAGAARSRTRAARGRDSVGQGRERRRRGRAGRTAPAAARRRGRALRSAKGRRRAPRRPRDAIRRRRASSSTRNRNSSLQHDVVAAVVEFLGLHDLAGAADRVNRRVAGVDLAPESARIIAMPIVPLAGERVGDHRPVAGLEDVRAAGACPAGARRPAAERAESAGSSSAGVPGAARVSTRTYVTVWRISSSVSFPWNLGMGSRPWRICSSIDCRAAVRAPDPVDQVRVGKPGRRRWSSRRRWCCGSGRTCARRSGVPRRGLHRARHPPEGGARRRRERRRSTG